MHSRFFLIKKEIKTSRQKKKKGGNNPLIRIINVSSACEREKRCIWER